MNRPLLVRSTRPVDGHMFTGAVEEKKQIHDWRNNTHKNIKMQSETADFAPGAATWRTWRSIRVVFDSGLFNPLYENMTSSAKPKVHVHDLSHCRQRTELWSQVTCTTKIREIWSCGLWDMWASRQINRRTYRHSVCNISHPYRGEIAMLIDGFHTNYESNLIILTVSLYAVSQDLSTSRQWAIVIVWRMSHTYGPGTL